MRHTRVSRGQGGPRTSPIHTFVGLQLGELVELALLWSWNHESRMDLESPRGHVDAKASLLGFGFSPLTIRYVFDELGLFYQLANSALRTVLCHM